MPLNGSLSVTVNYRTNVIKVNSFIYPLSLVNCQQFCVSGYLLFICPQHVFRGIMFSSCSWVYVCVDPQKFVNLGWWCSYAGDELVRFWRSKSQGQGQGHYKIRCAKLQYPVKTYHSSRRRRKRRIIYLSYYNVFGPHVGPGVYRCRRDPLHFLAGWRKGRLNQAFSFVLV